MSNLIPDIAAGKESLFVYSLTDANKAIWSDTMQLRMATGGRNRRRPFRDVYIWDLYRLAELVGEDRGDGSGYWTLDGEDSNWKRLWVDGLSDNAGSGVYESLPTPFAVSPFTRPLAKGHVYRANFRFSPLIAPPLITTDDEGNVVVENQPAETEPAELVIYKAIIYPGYPLMFGSSLASHAHFGPNFINTAKISVTGRNKLGPVEVSVDADGGKALVSPLSAIATPALYEITPQTLPDPTATPAASESETEETPSEKEESTLDYRPYRSSCLIDCLVATKLYNSAAEMVTEMTALASQAAQNPEDRLVGMELSLKQEMHYEFPVPSGGRTDENGPRFASVTGRTVTGSLTYWSRTRSFELPNTGALTLYFGSIWFFPMPNIEWQKPRLEVVPGQGYLHTFEFIARAAPLAIQKGFITDAADYPISEFWLSSNNLDNSAGQPAEEEENNEEEEA
jgi:hypothetical protein